MKQRYAYDVPLRVTFEATEPEDADAQFTQWWRKVSGIQPCINTSAATVRVLKDPPPPPVENEPENLL